MMGRMLRDIYICAPVHLNLGSYSGAFPGGSLVGIGKEEAEKGS